MFSNQYCSCSLAILLATAASNQIGAFPIAPTAAAATTTQREKITTQLNVITWSKSDDNTAKSPTPEFTLPEMDLPEFYLPDFPDLPELEMPKMDFIDNWYSEENWYTEDNVLRGRIVYDDLPSEYTYISAGSNWPKLDASTSSSEISSNSITPSKRNHQSRIKPLKLFRKVARIMAIKRKRIHRTVNEHYD